MKNATLSALKQSLAQRLPYELWIGWRYTRAKRNNHFISFISLTSMIGIALGVMALIVVLSVMNGFQDELRKRILGVASHIEVRSFDVGLSDWQHVQSQIQTIPAKTFSSPIQGTAPYVMAQGMLTRDQAVQGVLIRGVLPAQEAAVSDLSSQMKVGRLTDLQAGQFNIVLGSDLAQSLGVHLGEKVVLMAPQGQVTPAGLVPRIKQFTVIGIFQVGMYEYDAGLALIHLDDAAKLYRMGDQVSGLRLKLADLFMADRVSKELMQALGPNYYITDWTQQHANFFKAIQLEKRVMFIILALIVAVAAFNIVSTLVMAVTDKRADIAILRTMGATPQAIRRMFVVQGAMIGVIGTISGAFLGVLLALNIETVVPWIEHTFNVQFLSKDVYYISDLPSKLMWSDVSAIVLLSIFLSLIATLYPSGRASKMNPAEALRYE
jgi:lipoprotein-releasing system permease protein